jgi:N-acyl homoserine lactone hydrolase
VTARVTVLLHGYAYSSPDEGSVGFCGVYLVEAFVETPRPWRLVFDTGHAGRRRALRQALARHDLSPTDIDAVLLSHGHWDHIQNLDVFARSQVYAHPDEISYLQAPAPDDPATPAWTGAVLAGHQVQPVQHGDELAAGVAVIGLPGHTAGSIGLTVATDAGRAVLTGDAVSSAHALRTGRCTVVRHDAGDADRSLRLLAGIADLVYPGHDHPFRVSHGLPGDYLSSGDPAVLRGPDPAKPALELQAARP